MNLTQWEREWIVQQSKKNIAAINHELNLLKANQTYEDLVAENRALDDHKKCVAWDKAIAMSDKLLKLRR